MVWAVDRGLYACIILCGKMNSKGFKVKDQLKKVYLSDEKNIGKFYPTKCLARQEF